ncbi:MAG: Cache 3/Cache 2 fusion domain-containing protein [Desulfarculus sp.]|nr:Cache 3/Cache 2 fusion domain-containing protein [Desulfarculus sp.]
MALVVIPLLLVGLLAQYRAGDALETMARLEAHHTAQRLADLAQVFLAEEIKLVKELASGNTPIRVAAKVAKDGLEASAADIADLDKKLTSAMKDIGQDYEAIVVTDASGKVIADSVGGTNKGINTADRDYFQSAKAGQASVGQPVKSKKTGNPVVVLATPIPSNTGFVGIMMTILKLEVLSNKISGTKLGKTGYAFMTDKSGSLIAHPDPKLLLDLNITTLKGMEEISRRMTAGETGTARYVYKEVPKQAGFAPVQLTGWSVGATQDEEEFLSPVRGIRNGMLLIGAICLALALVAIVFFVRGINRPIMRVVSGLNEAADQVTSAATEVSSASQSLADGASQQASSLEETSASLEEMASMVRQNADHASEADVITKAAGQTMAEANRSMKQLTVSMGEISQASEEISKIIKTIDEIAFQTNLLALNAAVEAARAGEAGAGFAVVADEVRNLAMRAGEAAKNTAGLIEGTVQKIKGGAELVDKTNRDFGEVATNARKIGELVGEIAAASKEQAQGIGQINQAMNQMDRLTQSNAASAEETASAAEEMNGQAKHMKEFVADLTDVVGGAAGLADPAKPAGGFSLRRKAKAAVKATPALPPPARHATPAPTAKAAKAAPAAKAEDKPAGQRGKRPEDVIPLDDADFKDF